MIFIVASAAFVGFVHSLVPGHWLPIVLVAKSRKWSTQTAVLGAGISASGHILLSNLLGAVSVWIGAQVLNMSEESMEKLGSVILMFFGVGYAAWSYFRHSHCHGHTHHGPDPASETTQKKRGPFAFLFFLGFSPCIAVLPVFGAASVKGTVAVLVSMISFSLGVLVALIGSTVLVTHGLSKLDHPILEHYGDVMTGLGIAIMGLVLYFTVI